MSAACERRDQRFASEIRIIVRHRGEDLGLLSENVSFRGVFLRTDAALPTMQLLAARVCLPDGRVIRTNIVVRYVVSTGGYVRGVGASFIGLDGESLGAWEGFVRGLRQEGPAAEPNGRERRESSNEEISGVRALSSAQSNKQRGAA